MLEEVALRYAAGHGLRPQIEWDDQGYQWLLRVSSAEHTVRLVFSPADIKAQFRSASILKDRRVVFNICGNKYRLIVKINYDHGVVRIRFVGTHKKYDAIDAETI